MADNSNRNYYDGQILEIYSIDHRFNRQNAFEIMASVGIFNPDKTPKTKIEVYLEMSMEYGKGNNVAKTQLQMSMETLHSLGLEGDDVSNERLATLVGKPCRICEQTTDKGDKRYYFSNSRPTVKIADANDRVKQMMAGIGGAPAPAASPFNAVGQAPAAAPAATPPNPFAGM